jgi:hypothetical protein
MWNYRITFDGVEYSVREVYYDAAGYPEGWTNPVTLTGLTLSEIHDTLELMKLALDKPVITIGEGDVK